MARRKIKATLYTILVLLLIVGFMWGITIEYVAQYIALGIVASLGLLAVITFIKFTWEIIYDLINEE